MALIEIKNFGFKYPLQKDWALKEINLKIEKGTFYGIIGKNGSGKSSLCYALRGFIPHFYSGKMEGDITIEGKNIKDQNLGELGLKIGFVFQNPFNQISGATLTVFEEIAYGLENLGVNPEEIIKKTNKVIELLGIEELKEKNPYELSGGQQQKVAIASILVMEPEILILDEPTSQLDPIGTVEILETIKSLKKEDMTIILVEHKLDLIAEICNQLIVLKDGHIHLKGPLKEVFTEPDFTDSGMKRPEVIEITQKLKEDYGYNLEPALTLPDCLRILRSLQERSS